MKIFVIVGTLFPFDRLIEQMDTWAGKNSKHQITAQIGKTKYTPKHMEYYSRLDAADFNKKFEEADLIVSHAGMGVILKALMINKPIVIIPRKLELNEHTTDHQIATTKAVEARGYVNVAWENEDLNKFLENPEEIKSKKTISKYATEPLINGLKAYFQSI